MPEVEKIQAVQKAEFEAEQAKLDAVEGKAVCGCGAGENAADGADLEPMDVEAKEEIHLMISKSSSSRLVKS